MLNAKDTRAECGVLLIDILGSAEPVPVPVQVDVRCTQAVLFDDFGDVGPCGDGLVVNMQVGAEKHSYGVPACLGPQWALLRPKGAVVPRFAPPHVIDPNVPVVAMRLDAPDHITTEVLKRLGLIRSFRSYTAPVAADIAVVSASMTALECLAAGLPTLVYPQTERHDRIANALCEAGAVLHYSPEHLDLLIGNADLRHALSARAQQLVDGRGAERLANLLMGMR
jgi:spore coat polysaccharide biosynthesis predicted glycosyltransferase SpsG